MLELFIANRNYSSWSLRPWVLLRELAIPFEERLVPFGSAAWDEFLEWAPAGRVPCLRDDGLLVWDSMAITEYVAEAHPVWPTDRVSRAWARSAAAEMHSGFAALRSRCPMNCGLRVRLHEVDGELAADVARIDALWSEGLDRFGGPFLAGSRFTAVDAFFAPVAFRARSFGLDLGEPAAGWVRRILALESMRAWDRAALEEEWRDEPHEEEIRAVGDVLEDLRRSVVR